MNADELVKIYSGPLEIVKSYCELLEDAGITAKTVGNELTSGIGSALPATNELWVHSASAKRAVEVIEHHAAKHGHPKFPHPTDDKTPKPPVHRQHTHVNPDPHGN